MAQQSTNSFEAVLWLHSFILPSICTDLKYSCSRDSLVSFVNSFNVYKECFYCAQKRTSESIALVPNYSAILPTGE